jgi:lipoprotein-releasing system ATP-binding protein
VLHPPTHATKAAPALEARGLRHAYPGASGPVEVLHGIDLAVPDSTVVAVVGPSGSGKSTLLHLLGGLDIPSAGRVLWGGVELRGKSVDDLAALRAREVGFIFQHHYLLEDLTALDNVIVPGLIAGKPDPGRARHLLDRVGLGSRGSLAPRALSGGERQRVALARALLTRPRLVLADEPTGSLDRPNADLVFSMLVELAREEGSAVVIVTHDERLAAIADTVVHLDDGLIVDAPVASLDPAPR